ncbi:MAG: nucleotidyltransferase family protein [Candidatus Brocadiia bacterium]
MTRKAVILAGGRGSRMQDSDGEQVELDSEARRLADKGLKGLIPVDGRPFMDYLVDSLVDAGIQNLCLVISPGCRELQNYVQQTNSRTSAQVEWTVQEEPRGTADALLTAGDFADDEPFIMCNCDNLYPSATLRDLADITDRISYVVAFEREQLLERSNFGEDRVRNFAVIQSEGDRLANIVEKPQQPDEYRQNGKLWVNMNLYRFSPEIFDACGRIAPDPDRGELELTAAVLLLAREQEMRVRRSRGGVIDITGRRDVEQARRMINTQQTG